MTPTTIVFEFQSAKDRDQVLEAIDKRKTMTWRDASWQEHESEITALRFENRVLVGTSERIPTKPIRL